MENFTPIQEQLVAKSVENKIKKGLFGFRYSVSGKPVKKRTVYFDVRERNYLLECLRTGKADGSHSVEKSTSEVLGLTAYVEAEKNFVALQLLQYVPYMYQPITDTVFYHGEQAQELCKALKL